MSGSPYARPPFNTPGVSDLPAQAGIGVMGVVLSLPGQPGAGAVYNIPLLVAAFLPANLAGTIAQASAAPAANYPVSLGRISGGVLSAIGTTTLQAGSVATLVNSAQAGVAFSAGDTLQIALPATADASLSGLGLTVLMMKA